MGYSSNYIVLSTTMKPTIVLHLIVKPYASTVECRYNAVQYYKILNKWLEELRKNINQMLDPQKTPYLALTGEL